jgi:Glycosyl hydrolases family 2, sugar binding domain/Glycosyl hydrolases family 2, TIM barrel domain/Glycosyl hydrolases family 2
MPRTNRFRIAAVLLAFAAAGAACAKNKKETPDWNPTHGRIMTRWAAEVRPDNALPDYPRPQMVRSEWLNLNGLWEYAIVPAGTAAPERYDGHILVPYPVESALSGVGKAVGKENRLWYKTKFRLPKDWQGRRVLLNFEAVDWETRVLVNGREAGSHKGGYDPFSFDVTPLLKKRGEQEIVVSVWDPIDEGTQPRGKQVRNPHGIWYTSVTGIWSTVWLEPVNGAHIRSFEVVPDLDGRKVRVKAAGSEGALGLAVDVSVLEGSDVKASARGKTGDEISVDLAEPKPWSPESPFLYNLKLTLLGEEGRPADDVAGYFGMRRISLGRDGAGHQRLFLNGAPLFEFGPLDQGWWPDGLYTAPTDAALRYDIEMLKDLGFNMMRKHVKVEPRRFYYWCDKLGLLVWQDMPSGDAYIQPQDPDIHRTEESAKEYEEEFANIIKTLANQPSIIMWVPFNEGWGQFDTARIVDRVRSLDPTRLVDAASGWTDRGVGDVIDVHAYPGPAAPPNQPDRAAVLGEFGGLGLPVRGHTWQEEKNWGYRSFTTPEELTAAYLALIDKLKPLVAAGVSAAVYTQTTDVEVEVNGLMTYDRDVLKMDKDKVTQANKSTYPLLAPEGQAKTANSEKGDGNR